MKRVLLVLLSALVFEGACTSGSEGARDAATLDLMGGLAGYALAFDGVQDYATAGNAGFPQAGGEQTLALWVNPTSLSGTQDFIVLRQDFDNGVQLGIRDGTVAAWTTYAHTTLAAAPAAPSLGTWHHVAYTYDHTTQRLYLDGNMVATSTANSDKRTPTSAWLGTVDGAAELFQGKMDEVRIWTVARTPAELLTDMLHGTAPGETGLVAYWTFDDSEVGGRCRDSSGLGNDVTLGDGVVAYMPDRVPSDAPVAP